MINERVKQLRKTLDLNQTEFGEKLGVSRSVIVNLELSKVNPKELFLNHLCSVFNVNIDWLFSGEGEMFNCETQVNKNLIEFTGLFDELTPELQDYVLKQVKDLLKIQNQIK